MNPLFVVPVEVRAFWEKTPTNDERIAINRTHAMARPCFQCQKVFTPIVMMKFYNDAGRLIHHDGGPLELFGDHWNELVKHWDKRHKGSPWQHQFVFGLWMDGTVQYSNGQFCTHGCAVDFAREHYD